MEESRPHTAPNIAAWSTDPVPLVTGKDLLLLAYLPLMLAIAWCVPERFWPMLCRRLAWTTARLPAITAAQSRTTMLRVLGRNDAALTESYVANHHLARLQGLRWYRAGSWRPQIRLVGREHVDRTLLLGKGGVLWVPPMAFSDLVTKMAFHRAGFSISHLSRIQHGLSTSRLGARLFNPIWTAVERRYLAERLVMAPGQSAGALRELVRRLRENRLVSIAVGSQGLRTHSAPFLRGSICIADGAPSLARRTGAPLLPVFTVRLEDGSFVTTVEPPLEAPDGLARDEAVRNLAQQCAALIASYVSRWPDQFQSWDAVTPATGRG